MIQFLQTPLTVVHVITCLVLITVVLIQPGKSGGLGAAFGGAGAQQVFGGRGAGNLLTRVSWITMTIFFLTSMTLAYMSSSADASLESKAKAAEADSAPAKSE
ncbi:MAG: preprotein translocase subunit SecG [Polyangiaceae bacterium]|nr:preprotein translocase subunit SecG [Polyangiaceae bacterium]MCW5788895.1 preprotein translocase subunit SecG [Polyangiaceae bacterium]